MNFYQNIFENKQLGRAFNHLEDLVFFYGSTGAHEALDHLRDLNQEAGSKSVRMKWDGGVQIYWGRSNGEFVPPHGHNQWGKKEQPGTSDDVRNFILTTGKAATPEEIQKRTEFANKFASLSDMFARATPKKLNGSDTFFVYADALYLERPPIIDGVYTFCPNPKSQTCYHVRADSDLGDRISKSKVMVVAHAYFPEHGLPDHDQIPLRDFSAFNTNTEVIVLGPIYNVAPVTIDNSNIEKVATLVNSKQAIIDKFLEPVQGLSDLKNIIYTYVNQMAKNKQLDQLNEKTFFEWVDSSGKVSVPKAEKIKNLNQQHGNAVFWILKIVRAIQLLKNQAIEQIEQGPKAEIWDTNGEGRVRYADSNKKFGNVKFVPRHRWTPL